MAKAERESTKESVVSNVIAILKEYGQLANDSAVSRAPEVIKENLIVDLVLRFSIFIKHEKPLDEKQEEIFKKVQDKQNLIIQKGEKYVKLEDKSTVNLKDVMNSDMKALLTAWDALSSILGKIDKSGKEKVIEELKMLGSEGRRSDRSAFLRKQLDQLVGKEEVPSITEKSRYQNTYTSPPPPKDTALHIAVKSGNIKEVDRLRGDPNIDVNACDAQNKTALDIAVELRRADLVSSLLRYPRIDKVYETLNNAINNTLDDVAKKNISNYEILQKNNFEIINQLINKGIKCSVEPFRRAVLEDNIELVNLLTKKPRRHRDIEYWMRNEDIFITAWKKGVSKEMLDILVMHGANMNYDHNPKNMHTKITNLLHESLEKREFDKAKQLIIYGADTSLPNEGGVTPADLIHSLNDKELKKLLETQKAEVAESLELMKKIQESKAIPPNCNDEQLNKLMFFLEHETLTYSIKKIYNFQGEYTGRKKANVIINTVQGIINKYQNAKKRAAQLAGNLLQPGPSGASSSPPRTPSPELKGSSRAL